ncbi:MAG: hypothetical protein AAGC95_00035 [Pseudomonadota bacterium]
MARILYSRSDALIVGAIDTDDAKIGKNLKDLIRIDDQGADVVVSRDAEAVLSDSDADIALLSTTAFAQEAEPLISSCLGRGLSVLGIVQELFFPVGPVCNVARRVDKAARAAGRSVAAVGINPGFIMDLLPLVCTTPCAKIARIEVERNVDFSPYGPDEMVHIGAGLTAKEFAEGAAAGYIGHIGLVETAAFVAQGAGLKVDRLVQTKEALLAKTVRKTSFLEVQPGRVCGFRQYVSGYRDGDVVLNFKMNGVLDPNADEDGFQLGDHARIHGDPNVDIQVRREVSSKGGVGTAAVAVNTIPRLLAAAPGFHTTLDLGFPKMWTGASDVLIDCMIEK